MRVLGIITARGGSKRLPNKNTKILGDKPLIAWTIESALKAKYIDKVIVSSDNSEIIAISKKFGAEVPFVRPEELSSDSASSVSVLLHALDWFRAKGVLFDYIVLLQPTSPFRKEGLIDSVLLQAINNPDVDMVVTVKPLLVNPLYNIFVENSEGYLYRQELEVSSGQQKQTLYSYNGSIYAIKVSSLEQLGSLNFDKVLKFQMDEIDSVDIDTSLDFDFASFLLSKK